MRVKKKLQAAYKLIVWLCVICLYSLSYAQESDCERSKNPVTNIGKRFSISEILNINGPPKPVFYGNARYLRIRINIKNRDACKGNWYVTVRDDKDHALQTFTQEDFLTTENGWTIRIPRGLARVEAHGCSDGSGPDIKLDKYIAMPQEANMTPFYSTKSLVADYKPLYDSGSDFSSFRPLGDFVGFMMSSWDRKSWSCSGVMVTSDLFLTNWHCGGLGRFKDDDGLMKTFPEILYWDKDSIVKDTIVDISWDDDPFSREYVATSLVASDPDLDFALLKLSPINSFGKAVPVAISLVPVGKGEDINIIHHPLAAQKQISRCKVQDKLYKGWRNNKLLDFTYDCDTEGGSSGSPIFNSHNQLIGIHHLGFEYNASCQQSDHLNKGVHISKIIEYLCTNNHDDIGELSMHCN